MSDPDPFVSMLLSLGVYFRLTQKMVQIFYCVLVELRDGETWYWAEDTTVQCYSVPHRYLVLFAGLPLLVFVTFGFPIVLFVKLYRRRNRLATGVVVSRYGIFFQPYHASFAHWDVFVLARKGTLAILSVLSLTFSDGIKGYSALFIILVSIALHTWCRPYKERKLNMMEMVSLVISSIVIIFNGMTLTPEGSENFTRVMSLVNMILLTLFVIYMLYEVVMASKNTMQNWLKAQDEYSEHRGGVISAVGVWVNIISSRSLKSVASVGRKLKLRSADSFDNEASVATTNSIEESSTSSED